MKRLDKQGLRVMRRAAEEARREKSGMENKNQFKSVIPLLFTRDVAATVAYYREVLGYQVSQSGDYWGSALRGKANFYFTKPSGDIHPAECFVYVDDVDELCADFRAKGAKITQEPENKPWGFRQFTLEDCNGHQLHYFRFADGVE